MRDVQRNLFNSGFAELNVITFLLFATAFAIASAPPFEWPTIDRKDDEEIALNAI